MLHLFWVKSTGTQQRMEFNITMQISQFSLLLTSHSSLLHLSRQFQFHWPGHTHLRTQLFFMHGPTQVLSNTSVNNQLL